MKAVGFYRSLPISEGESLLDLDLDMPTPKETDLLVQIEAVSINPADAKRRIRTSPDSDLSDPMILGYDAVGIVTQIGAGVTGFKVGDRVWYAGDVTRDGSYAEYQAVDFRLVSHAPKSATPEAAAALPLTALTSWEMLFERLKVDQFEGQPSLLVIGGAGGVGSFTIQMARALTGARVIATASRVETSDWCYEMGAYEVVNHRDLIASTRATGHESVQFITQYADTAQHWDAMCALIAPQGKIGTIVETEEKIDISALQGKSASLHWELMFTRSIYQTSDMAKQGQILARVAQLVDDGILRTTDTKTLHGLSAETLKEAHKVIETGAMIGKLVVRY
ncbi:zinc-binding alcohol dehydrogenase family protein [Cognatishimia sp.]|uniref:zinc-binding alcohol dehydrogenase family protein n=1 Tax=Cognatishimia sp. TaxID=2211648 RepID=UPI003514A297